ncbi:ABC transporter permease [Cytobacillus purgationiresistens]|uniref:Ribose transport system permease protein n=1 Tax=Cytobacillus purgationiresistens TaxID=863449 RepID=A0ABU0AM78_9BACI|nr:ABC transporter permease [Cytobacillus purgationiresistens]MDQ0272365.1 ribose transport system permease protein [Cytobacillus purgationiresistens]
MSSGAVEAQKVVVGKTGLRKFLEQNVILLVLFIMIVFMAAISDDFFTTDNIINLLRQISILGILTLGQTFVLSAGNFDLSVGALLSLASILVIGLQPELGVGGAIAITLVVSILVGLCNGWLVGRVKANSFIVTLGMMSLLQAAALVFTGGMTLQSQEPSFATIGGGSLGGMPYLVLYFVIAAILFQLLLNHSVFGRKVLLTGSNSVAARFAGVKVGNIVSWTFVISSLTAAFGGILISSRIMSASPTAGAGMELDVISAAVLGGTSIYGGEGRAYNPGAWRTYFGDYDELHDTDGDSVSVSDDDERIGLTVCGWDRFS